MRTPSAANGSPRWRPTKTASQVVAGSDTPFTTNATTRTNAIDGTAVRYADASFVVT